MQTLLLSVDNWDLTLDASGNIATASGPYALAQDVASACKVFAGELWYDTDQGIPYLENILGQSPPLQYIKSQLEDAALTVPGVVSALCVLAGLNGRLLSGQIQLIDTTGATTNVQF
jgi:hypothetical protein